MTWSEFAAHAEGQTKQYSVRTNSKQRRLDLRLDPPTEGSLWLEDHAPRLRTRRREWPDMGYYGPTQGIWYVGNSEGTFVLMMEQTSARRRQTGHSSNHSDAIQERGDHDGSDRQLILMLSDGLSVPVIAAALGKTVGYVIERIHALARAKNRMRKTSFWLDGKR